MNDKFEGLRKAVRVGYQVSTDEIRALLGAYDVLMVLGTVCPACGSDRNERDELEKAEREIERLRSAPARPEDMAAFAAGLKADHAKTQAFFKAAGILTERGELMPEYGGPQQAEPVEIVPRVWREALRKLTFMARTSGGTPGPDEGLQTACAEAETLLSKPYNYPPAAPQQAEPVAQIGWADEFGNLFPMAAWKPAQRTHHDAHKTAWRPVFLHPPADEVRRLRDALDEIESETQDVSIQQIARKALEGK